MSDNGDKMFALSRGMAKAGEEPVTLHAGEPGWTDWLTWRRRNRLGTGFMMSRKKWGVPSKYPPTGTIDEALAQYGAGSSKKRNWT